MLDAPADPVRLARIGSTDLSVDEALGAVAGAGIGGIGVFVGVVRDHDGDQGVQSLDYTAHPAAEAELRACAARVADRHPGVRVAVTHRVGRLDVGDLAVVVAAGAAHRGAALSACRELIDDLKASVPIWKQQQFTSGAVSWVGLP